MGLAALLSTAGPAAAEPGTVTLEVTVRGIKSDKGVIRLAICPPGAGFPDCKDRVTRSAALPIANGTASVVLTNLAPGSYAVSVFHDANGNSKLDTFVGIPKEGYGFSRNPPFRPRAPRFDEAQVDLTGNSSTVITLRYLL
jgi:uncharacterized protein (DUF2141 family)